VQGYTEDLAYIHDTGFGHLAEKSAPALLKALRAAGLRGGLVVDLGCGSGLLARRILRAGYSVLGVDQSPAMVAIARRNAPGAEFRTGSFTAVALPRCQAITAVGEVFNYRFDPRNTRAALARLFRRAHAALDPGGLFVFDLAGPGRVAAGGVRTFRCEDDWAIVFEAREAAGGRAVTRWMTTFRRVGRIYRRSDETHRLRLYRPAEVVAALRSAGFQVTHTGDYGALKLSPGHTAYFARKPLAARSRSR
jgi:SAM-dependent methyltransferase